MVVLPHARKPRKSWRRRETTKKHSDKILSSDPVSVSKSNLGFGFPCFNLGEGDSSLVIHSFTTTALSCHGFQVSQIDQTPSLPSNSSQLRGKENDGHGRSQRGKERQRQTPGHCADMEDAWDRWAVRNRNHQTKLRRKREFTGRTPRGLSRIRMPGKLPALQGHELEPPGTRI